MYKILWRSNDQILHEKVLDDGVAQELIDAHNHLNKNIRCLDFYYIVKKDLSDFIDYMKNQQDSAENPDGVEINRLLYNFTNALYSYIEYLEKNFKTAFSIVKKEIYDTQFSYRLMYALRAYITHNDFGITEIQSSFYPDKIVKAFFINLKNLIESSCINKKFKEELMWLSETNSRIDIYKIASEFSEVFINFQEKLILTLQKEIINSFNILLQYVPEQRTDVFLYQDNTFKKSIFNIINKYYQKVAYDFIYKENIFNAATHQELTELFMMFSYLY